MQSICAFLIFGDPEANPGIHTTSPWFDLAHMEDVGVTVARLASQQHRRYIKTHTPIDGIPYFPDSVYLAVYRHPLDVHFSMRRHARNVASGRLDEFHPKDAKCGFEVFLKGSIDGPEYDAPSLSGLIHHYKAFLSISDRPNVHVFHYEDLKRDLHAGISQISQALSINHPPELVDAIVQAATFDNMKSKASTMAPGGGSGMLKSDSNFFDSASSNKWLDRLTQDEVDDYGTIVGQLLTPKERRWLEFGSV